MPNSRGVALRNSMPAPMNRHCDVTAGVSEALCDAQFLDLLLPSGEAHLK